MRGWTLAVVLLVAGAGAVVAGFLPGAAADEILRRVLPLLIFLGSVFVLAELTAKAEVFDVVAVWLLRRAAGSYLKLFGLCVVFASATTIFLNLDTTAVLLTPVMLAAAVRADIPGLPMAMLTAWLANTGSLLLPVSNLTNLLAADRVSLSPTEFAVQMAVPQAAAISATASCLWLFYWRRGRRGSLRYSVPDAHLPHDRVLAGIAAGACGGFVVLVLVGVPLAVSSLVGGGIVAGGFLVRDRGAFSWTMIPFRLLVFVTGVLMVVQTVGGHGLDRVLGRLIGPGVGVEGLARVAVLGAVLSNAINNLPAYVAGEAAIPHDDQLLGLLIATNVSPLITPWASLAIMIWYRCCRCAGVRIAWGRFAATGAVTAVLALVAAEGALVLSHG